MRDISAVAEHLRTVRRAQREFLSLWAMEQALILPGLDRVAADMDALSSQLGSAHSFSELDGDGPAADE